MPAVRWHGQRLVRAAEIVRDRTLYGCGIGVSCGSISRKVPAVGAVTSRGGRSEKIRHLVEVAEDGQSGAEYGGIHVEDVCKCRMMSILQGSIGGCIRMNVGSSVCRHLSCDAACGLIA